MNDPHVCQRCGRELAEDAPEGICPSCLMEANLGTEAGTLATVGGGRREPLSVADVARLFPEMEILGLIGTGGMGAVYKARQPKLDRFVALKILHADERDPSFIDRFTREARTLARLSHPNIVAVYDFGQRSRRREEAGGAEEGDVAEGPPPHVGGYGDEGSELFFLIMELVDGVTLRDLLRGGQPGSAELHSASGKPSGTRRPQMQPEQALAIVPPICEALQYAHEKGVVHRDIKPENILLDKDGRVKVADFGIARLAGVDRAENLTGEGQVIGTAHYMAPEQVERPASVDHRADIYALGVVFYEMLTGELPLGRFPHPSKKVQIDVRLDEVVLKALEKEPELRYQQASEVRTRVATIASSRGFAASTAGMEKTPVQSRVVVPAVGLMVVGAVNMIPALALLIRAAGSPNATIAILPLLIWGAGIFSIVFGGFRMMRLESYGWAVAGAIVAMILPPGLLIGIPIGIWALVVLSRKEVREAFPRSSAKALSAGTSRRAKRVLWTSGAVLAVLIVGGIFLAIAGIVASIALPALSRARAEPQAQAGNGLSDTLPEPLSRGDYQVTLPNGVSIEVMAVCRNPRDSNLWWRPDGTPLPEGTVEIVSGLDEGGIRGWLGRLAPWQISSEPSGGADKADASKNEVLVYVRRNYPLGWPDDLFWRHFKWSPSSSRVRQFPNVRWRGAESGTASADLLSFHEVPDVLNLSVTMPLGPWEPVAIFDGRETRELVSDVTAVFQPAPNPKEPNDVALEIIHNLDVFRHHGVRLMARLKDGSTRQAFIHSTAEHSKDLFKSTLLVRGAHGFRLSDVKKYELARTPLATGEINGIRLAPRMADEAANSSAGAAVDAAISWGPVMERVVNDDSERRHFMIDLDNGSLSPSPDELHMDNQAALLGWAESQGLDAGGETNTSIRGLVGLQMKVIPLAKLRWETISAAEVAAALQEASPRSPSFLSAKGDLPETFLFQTREGGRGVLQITGFAEEPRGVAIRYKLVQKHVAERQQSPGDILPELQREGSQSDLHEMLEAPDALAVMVKTFGQDHLSYRGDAEKFSDACRTVLKSLSYKEIVDQNSTRYPHYREGGTSYASDGRGVAERTYQTTKDEHGAEYTLTTVFLDGQDPLVMLESTSKDPYRLINALLAEFNRLGFRVEEGGG